MAEEKKSFFARLREGLTKTRNNIVKGFDSVFSGYSVIDNEFYEELEETMIMGDLGGRATEEILDRLKEQVNDQGICGSSGLPGDLNRQHPGADACRQDSL